MLILTRRVGESVYIGDDVRLTVLGVRGTQVRIGINAPKEVPVHREEIYHRIKNEGADAAAGRDSSNSIDADSEYGYDPEDPEAEEDDPHNV